MTYTVQELARLSGVTVRALHHYDQIGLLRPASRTDAGYRLYGVEQVDRLQQILFLRELDLPLDEIASLLSDPSFEQSKVLLRHRKLLQQRIDRLNGLLGTLDQTLLAMKGKLIMSDKEKFECFKQEMVDNNEKQYGEEARRKYGDSAVDASNQKIKGLSREQYAAVEKLTGELNQALKAAFAQGDPGSELAQRACALHKQWLCVYWEHYSPGAHMGVAQMYVDDPRFTAYYDKIAPGCAPFLRDAVNLYCQNQ